MSIFLGIILVLLTATPGWAGDRSDIDKNGIDKCGREVMCYPGGAGGGRGYGGGDYCQRDERGRCRGGAGPPAIFGDGEDHTNDVLIPIPPGRYRGTFTEKNLDKLLAGEDADDPCVAQMREAMKAMAPFVGPIIRFHFDGSERWIHRKLDAGKEIRDVFVAQEQWDAAKRDCLKETP